MTKNHTIFPRVINLPAQGFAIFIPCYNEIKSIANLRTNIRLVNSIFPDCVIIISDNHSTDGTWMQLLKLQRAHRNVMLFRNRKNLGFPGNIANLMQMPPRSIIWTIGVNDLILRSGALKLKQVLLRKNLWDLAFFNWAYFVDTKDGVKKQIGIGDIYRPARINTLNQYIAESPYFPNGITQWVCRAKYWRLLKPHLGLHSPHLGVFFDVFPARVCRVGIQPLCSNRHVENEGWRSSSKSIFFAHLAMHNEIEELVHAHHEKIDDYKQLLAHYKIILLKMMVRMRLSDGWGKRYKPRIADIRKCHAMISGRQNILLIPSMLIPSPILWVLFTVRRRVYFLLAKGIQAMRCFGTLRAFVKPLL